MGTKLSVAMTIDTLKDLAKSIVHPSIRLLLVLGWTFAARIRDLVHIRRSDVQVHVLSQERTQIAITFRKGARWWGPYTLVAGVDPIVRGEVLAALVRERDGEAGERIFTAGHQQALSSLVRGNGGGLNLRSVRRGALMHMAERGV